MYQSKKIYVRCNIYIIFLNKISVYRKHKRKIKIQKHKSSTILL